jgi:hypothetical protein
MNFKCKFIKLKIRDNFQKSKTLKTTCLRIALGGLMSKEDEMPPSDSFENEEVLDEKVDNSEIKSEEEAFIKGYNEDIEPDRTDEEGLDEDEKVED